MPIPKMKEYVNIVSKDKESEEPPYMVLHSLQRIKKKNGIPIRRDQSFMDGQRMN